MLLINELRKKERSSTLGPRNWFITFDKSIVSASQDLILKKQIEHPLCVTGDVWLNTISPFINIDLLKEDIVDISEAFIYFSKISLTQTLPEISFNKLLTIAGPWLEYDLLSVDELRNIANEKFSDRMIEAQKLVEKEGIIYAAVMPLINEKMMDRLKIIESELKDIKKNRNEIMGELNDVKNENIITDQEILELSDKNVFLSNSLESLTKNILKEEDNKMFNIISVFLGIVAALFVIINSMTVSGPLSIILMIGSLLALLIMLLPFFNTEKKNSDK